MDLSNINPVLPTVAGQLGPIRIALASDDCASDESSQEPASGEILDWLYVCLDYDYAVDSRREVELELAVWFEDGFPWERRLLTFEAEPRYAGGWMSAGIGPGPDSPWAAGEYFVYVYNEGVKVGETTFTITR